MNFLKRQCGICIAVYRGTENSQISSKRWTKVFKFRAQPRTDVDYPCSNAI